MLIKITEGKYDIEDDIIIFKTSFWDNIDHARAYINKQIEGKMWSSEHPGMVLDTYVFDKEYFPNSRQIKHYEFIKAERV